MAKKLFSISVLLLVLVCLLASCGNVEATKYAEATEAIESGDYETAYALFKELEDYKDAKQYLDRFCLVPTKNSGSSGVATVTLGKNNLPQKTIFTDTDGGQAVHDYTFDAP